MGGNRRAFIKGAVRAVGRRHRAETAVRNAEESVKTRGKSSLLIPSWVGEARLSRAPCRLSPPEWMNTLTL